MKRLDEILEPLVWSENTCKEVEQYFDKGNSHKGSYVDLANYFLGKKDAKYTKTDEAYKKWLKELIDTERESESIILSVLKKKYQTKEELYEFVFLLDDISPELNQKWHFFISYWGYREFITKYPEKCTAGLTPLTNGNEAGRANPFNKCTEGRIWYEVMCANIS